MLSRLTDRELSERAAAAELAIRTMGITFTVYDRGEPGGIDREWPFDIVPRLIRKREWDAIAQGLTQRVRALNAFIDDIYHHQRILRDGVVPAAYIEKSREFRPGAWASTRPTAFGPMSAAPTLVRDRDGALYVLEDNLRVPSGVSYMLENRAVMKRVFPELFKDYVIHPVDDYPQRLAACLRSLAPDGNDAPQIVVADPWHPQLGLLRTRLPGPSHGRRTGRGR